MNPKVSICIPFHFGMKNWQFFMTRCLESIEKQTFKDYEVVLINHSTMPVTSNRVIESATGELIKILYIDDWLESEDYLEKVYQTFLDKEVEWIITSANNNPNPYWTDNIHTGNNKLGSPSALAFRNNLNEIGNEMFDESLSWLLDADLYERLEKRFGKPTILTDINVGIGIGEHQMTNILTQEEKLSEFNYLKTKYNA